MRRIVYTLSLLFTTFIFLIACSAQETNNGSLEGMPEKNQIQVVTSIFPVYEITKEIAGDQADVSLMVAENEDAHHYEPSAQAVAAVNEADVFVYSSDVMEFWVDRLLDVVENEELRIVKLAEGLDLSVAEEMEHEYEEAHGHDHGGSDPHFWLDPIAVSEQLTLITEALADADAAGEGIYRENEAVFQQALNRLDEAYRAALGEAEHREFVVQHEAFGHLANRYDLHQIAVGGLTTEVEPSPRQLVEVIEFVKTQEVPVIYYQSGENSAIAETVANETDTEIAVLYDLENAPASLNTANNGNLYLEAMYANLAQLSLSVK